MVEESAQASSYPTVQIPKLIPMPNEITNGNDLVVQDDVNMIYEFKKPPTDGDVCISSFEIIEATTGKCNVLSHGLYALILILTMSFFVLKNKANSEKC